MKIVISVIIFNRIENLKLWAKCWDFCDKKEVELRIIHNYEKESDIELYRDICLKHNIAYIPRTNIGFDIGALQDILCDRLAGFDNNYEYMLWCTDDTIPMTKDFAFRFLNDLANADISCLEISDQVTRHIRTTGVFAKKENWQSIKFLKDPLITKEDAYGFEHRDGNMTLYKQWVNNGLICKQLDVLQNSVVWDIDTRKKLRRWDEHFKVFPEPKKVIFMATIYNTFPQIVSSLICQTHKNWELVLVHDGPNHTDIQKYLDTINDDRITYIEKPDRLQQYGHPHRQEFLLNLRNGVYPDSEFVVITNADNYYAPVFVEYMLKGFDSENIVASYCSEMTHSYFAAEEESANLWGTAKCKLELGFIDCGAVMVRKNVAAEIGWDDMSHSSDWTYFNNIIEKYSRERFAKVLGNLFVHN